ncbi:hypothetical protein [Rhizobium beringeri]|uniref:hypothetical protein n=1 Tax=Rhizobium beringeri TaxID=3019934 RepID=UPI003B5C413F
MSSVSNNYGNKPYGSNDTRADLFEGGYGQLASAVDFTQDTTPTMGLLSDILPRMQMVLALPPIIHFR